MPNALAIPLKQKPTPPKRPEIGQKLRAAIEAMVFEGLPIDKAARNAKLTTFAVRKALAKPHVIAFMREQKKVFRESVSGANILRLCEIRDAANNMPAVNAIKALEQLGDNDIDRTHLGNSRGPGITIVVNGSAMIAETPSSEEVDRAIEGQFSET